MGERDRIPAAELRRLEESIQAAAAGAGGEPFTGAARIHAGLTRALALAHSGAAWASPLALQYGQAFAAYLEQHGLYTYIARRQGSRCSLDLKPDQEAASGAAGSLVTLALRSQLRVEHGHGDEPLVYHCAHPGGFTLKSALEHGWAAVMDDLHPDCLP